MMEKRTKLRGKRKERKARSKENHPRPSQFVPDSFHFSDKAFFPNLHPQISSFLSFMAVFCGFWFSLLHSFSFFFCLFLFPLSP